MIGTTILIAEVKTGSPFGFHSKRSWDELFEVAKVYGDMISIHTDKRWNGSFSNIEKAAKLTSKPILAKGIHAADTQIVKALSLGASAVLVVGRIPKSDLLPYCIIEPTSLKQLHSFTKILPAEQRFAWNSRDLKDGTLKDETFDQVRNEFSGWLCQASNIKVPSDIHPSANAVLIGQNLLDFVKLL